jgi:hypothetical protein
MFSVKIPGRVVLGIGRATDALRYQSKRLIEAVPDAKDFYPSTLNVELACPLIILTPEVTIPEYAWNPQYPEFKESFGVVRIRLECAKAGPQPQDAIIYIPRVSPHRFNVRMVEIITKKVEGVAVGDNCAIDIRLSAFVR